MDPILILDADKYITWSLKTNLETCQYPVVVADTLESAMRNFSEFQVSGLITEYSVGSVSTLEAIRKLKNTSPEAYVMMVTDKEMKDDEYEEIIQSGVDDYFLKPTPFRKILLHLKKGLKFRNFLIEKKTLERAMEALYSSKGDGVAKIGGSLSV